MHPRRHSDAVNPPTAALALSEMSRPKTPARHSDSETCIYCRADFVDSGVLRSREHLFPKAFGCPNHLALGCVCRSCNESFKKLEAWFARDTVEGISRYRWRLPTIDKGTQLRRLGMEVPYEEAQYGPLRGLQVRPYPEKLGVVTFPLQIGFRFGTDLYRYFTWDMLVCDNPQLERTHTDLRDELVRNRAIAQSLLPGRLQLLGQWNWDGTQDQKHYEFWHRTVLGDGCPPNPFRLVGKLSLLGAVQVGRIKRQDRQLLPACFPDPEGLLVHFRGKVDRDIQRVLAKIAFNYAAWHRGPQALLDREFDAVRDFICQDRGESAVVTTGKRYTTDGTMLHGHLFRLVSGHEGLEAFAAFEGHHEYRVRLSKGRQPIFWHFSDCFDLSSGKLVPLSGTQIAVGGTVLEELQQRKPC